MSVPRVDLSENLFVDQVTVAHQRTVLNAKSILSGGEIVNGTLTFNSVQLSYIAITPISRYTRL